MNNKREGHINFSVIKRDSGGEGAVGKCPDFDSNKANYEDKAGQWRYYFAKHAKEVKEVLEGTKEVLCVDVAWMKEYMSAFVAGMQFSGGTKHTYIKSGNTTLREQKFSDSALSYAAHVRFKDAKDLDRIAKERHADELKSDMALLLSQEPLVNINIDLEYRILHDNILKNVVLLVAISAYGQNPLNLFLEGPSSTGKTYTTVETLKYFPQEDIWYIGGISPTALVHDRGEMEEIDGEVFKVVDLSRKILVFLEKPNTATIMKLLPILSHDVDQIEYRITDKNAKGQHATMKAIIRGFPAVIFCTTKSEKLQDLSTRNLLYAPEVTENKISAVVDLQYQEATEPWVLQQQKKDICAQVQDAMRTIRDNFSAMDVVLPYIDTVKVETGINPRIMRDNQKMYELIKSCTRLHVLQRLCLGYTIEAVRYDIIYATFFDVLVGLYLYDKIAVSTVTGLAPVVIDFFNDIIYPYKDKGACSFKDMQERYKKKFNSVIGIDTVRKSRIEPLEREGYITVTSEESDKRFKYFEVVQEIPTPETTGKSRIFKIGDKLELKKGKTRINNILKIPDIKTITYSGFYSTINLSDFSRDTCAIYKYLYTTSAIRYFLHLFPELNHLSHDEKKRILENPLISDTLSTNPPEKEGLIEVETVNIASGTATEGGEGSEKESPLISGTLKDKVTEATDEPRTSGKERSEISHGEDVEVVSMRGKQ